MNQHEHPFTCIHCNKVVPVNAYMGTMHRNHCPYCLFSKHVDDEKAGDRASSCLSPMEPIGLTFKLEGRDKYGHIKQGELMVIHYCLSCKKININRIASDDNEEKIIELLHQTSISQEQIGHIQKDHIKVLSLHDEAEVKKQLFGTTHS